MKKIVLCFLCIFSLSTFAQIDLRNTRFGAIGGFNYSRVRFAHNPSGPRYTFQAGITAQIPISSDDQFYLQPELVYFGAGESGKNKDAKGLEGYNAIYGNNYISLPIYLKAFFSEAESEFFTVIGPRFGFLLNQNIKNAPLRYTIEGGDPKAPKVNGKANDFSFGIGGGIGFSYKRKYEISLRYDMGLSNTYPNLVESQTNDPNTEKSKSEHVISISLNYVFD